MPVGPMTDRDATSFLEGLEKAAQIADTIKFGAAAAPFFGPNDMAAMAVGEIISKRIRAEMNDYRAACRDAREDRPSPTIQDLSDIVGQLKTLETRLRALLETR